jgi:hypothetical protein
MRQVLVAVHESVHGTNRTNRAGLSMSVVRGGPEVAGNGQNIAFDPNETSSPQSLTGICSSQASNKMADFMDCINVRGSL